MPLVQLNDVRVVPSEGAGAWVRKAVHAAASLLLTADVQAQVVFEQGVYLSATTEKAPRTRFSKTSDERALITAIGVAEATHQVPPNLLCAFRCH